MLALLFTAAFAAPASGGLAGAATISGPFASPVQPTVVTFAWGGGNASQMASLPLFRQYGMHAT